MEPIIDHIQITVQNFQKAVKFYDKLMPILGFDISKKSTGYVAEHEFHVIEYVHEKLIIGINSPRNEFADEKVHRRKPGALHHLAFKAHSKNEIDQIYPLIKDIGAEIVSPPQFYPQHGEKYYALFFKDLDGIKLELVFEEK